MVFAGLDAYTGLVKYQRWLPMSEAMRHSSQRNAPRGGHYELSSVLCASQPWSKSEQLINEHLQALFGIGF